MDTSPAPAAIRLISLSEATRERIDALNAEAWPLRFSDRDQAESLAREALALAEADQYLTGMALALRTLVVTPFVSDSPSESGTPSKSTRGQ